MSEMVLVDREQLERAASILAWMSCRSDIKAADLKRLEQSASELSCALTAPAAQAEPVAWYRPGEGGCDSQFRDHATVKLCTGNPWTGWHPLYARPQPAPDVAELVESLESAIKAFEEIQGGCATDRDICREEAAKIRAALAGKGGAQ